MNETKALSVVRKYVTEKYPDYPQQNLAVERFLSGWTVFAKSDPMDIESMRIGQTIFLVGDDGQIMESSSSLPPGTAEAEFVARYG